MRIEFENARYSSLSNPKMCLILTCGKERVNAITLAWHTPISKNPPLYGISVSPRRFSYGIIREEKEFALNFVGFDVWEMVHYCGMHSGKNEDKIANANIRIEPCRMIGTYCIADSYGVIECTLYKEKNPGDHTLFVGEVKRVTVDKEIWDGKKLKGAKIKPIYQLGSYTYVTIDNSSEIYP